MTRPFPLLAGIVLLLGLYVPAHAAEGASGAPAAFSVATVHVEQNATDADYEIVIEVNTGDEGLGKLTVAAPDGRKIIELAGSGAGPLGIRQFRFESPEPGDLESLKKIYPEGVYTFDGATAAGKVFRSQAKLSHAMPATAKLLEPTGPRPVGLEDLEVAWSPVKGVAGYIIEIEQPELGISVTARVPASVVLFTIPDAILKPGREYHLGIGTVSAEGSTTFVESKFTTVKK